ncbi:hypothetical protein [Clostridium sp. UBA3061]|uniref:hypothetical protein n=1 Tax=Clostridium sp. UBA3061 TaxID=1946353 RepID=UPI0032173342
MIGLLLAIGAVCIIVFFNNFVSILKKIQIDGHTSENTSWCIISIIVLWGISIFLCSI